ncbi:hypothetical protein [Pleionea sp. CnH1-48]|uniref:hypothetical protein n=1 Tax=Pleionea sp. CnH1-48 TaxID=2954494 RepID=UPI002097CE53|nr:hypothetical protein [Pleionea sp. CnH1-48]MCO7224113.1 hypothetical protein [Pleionea sp. CnH1-48]
MIDYSQLQCPSCLWVPDGEARWACFCGNTWNTFETKAKCSKCGTQWNETSCPLCNETTSHEAWYQRSDKSFPKLLEALNVPGIPEPLAQLWFDKFNEPSESLSFHFRFFSPFQLISPKGVMLLTYLIDSGKDRIHFSNQLSRLKESGKISEKQWHSYSGQMNDDLLLVSRDYSNRVQKYRYPSFDVKKIIPFGINGSNEYLCVGMAETGEVLGVYLYHPNIEAPIFISRNVDELLSNLSFGQTDEIDNKSKESFISSLLEDDDVYVYDAPQERDEEIDIEKQAQGYCEFVSSNLDKVFGIAHDVEFKANILRIKLGAEESTSFSIALESDSDKYYALTTLFLEANKHLNRFLHFGNGGWPEYYGFYLINDKVACLLSENVIKLARFGCLNSVLAARLPLAAYSSVEYPKVSETSLELVKDKDWSKNTIRKFLDESSRY